MMVASEKVRMRRWFLVIAGIGTGVILSIIVALLRDPVPVWTADSRVLVDLAFSPDGEKIAVISFRDGQTTEARRVKACVYDAHTGSLLEGDLGDGLGIAWSPDGSELAVAGWHRELRIHSTDDWRVRNTLELPHCYDGSLGYDPSGHVLCCVSYCSTNWDAAAFGAMLWGRKAGQLAEPVEIGRIPGDTAVSVAGARTDKSLRVAISYFQHETMLYRVESSGDDPQIVSDFEIPGTTNSQVRLTSDGRYLATRGGGRLRVLELATTGPVERFSVEAPQESDPLIPLRRLDLASVENRLAVVLAGRIEIRQVPSGDVLHTVPGSFAAVSIDPDGRQVAALSRKGPTLRIYRVEVQTGR